MFRTFGLNIFFVCLIGTTVRAQSQNNKQDTISSSKTDVKFLEDINVQVMPAVTVESSPVSNPKSVFAVPLNFSKKSSPQALLSTSVETASALQFKYALLLDIDIEQAVSLGIFQQIDQWLGTQYRLGGTSRDGIDCSALMQVFFAGLYGVSIPRTAREQHSFSRRIGKGELKEGDLVFFNTRGGVSHVGMYLQNNKFVHASSGGVTISDLYEDYWVKHFIGAGRVDDNQPTASLHP